MPDLKVMEQFLLNNTDHNTVNNLLEQGFEWSEAVELAYIVETN